MPIHDWTRVPAGLYHHFHQDWSIDIARSLNRGRLPKGLSALVEQRAGRIEPDVLAIESWGAQFSTPQGAGEVVTLDRPVTRIIRQSSKEIYADRANRIVVKHHLGKTIAVIEILSPGNKDSRSALRDFVEKTIDLLRTGIHVLIVDIFPPTPRDPFGIHKAIWDEIEEEDFAFPAGKDRILASYESSGVQTAYVEPVGIGQVLPDMPLFLAYETYVKVPLEASYQAAWDASPEALRTAVETGVIPNPDAL
ncbi:MAG: DUF4058 domain-containing protein [Planctomycetales bacterium]